MGLSNNYSTISHCENVPFHSVVLLFLLKGTCESKHLGIKVINRKDCTFVERARRIMEKVKMSIIKEEQGTSLKFYFLLSVRTFLDSERLHSLVTSLRHAFG